MGPKLQLAQVVPACMVLLLATAAAWPSSPASKSNMGLVGASVHAPKSAVVNGGSWTTYHHDDAHTGYDPGAPTLSSVQPTAGWTNVVLDGEVYAEPLVYNGIVYTATLNDTLYALNQADGTVLWSTNVGAPQTSGWSCSTLTPGILGTPVIDMAANRIYVAAELARTSPTNPAIYHLFGLDLGNAGSIVLDVPIPFPTSFDWKVQQQRGALALANGYIYVPFGGRAGDCFDSTTGAPYYSWVAGVPTAGGTTNIFQNPATGAGSWAAGGVVVDDTSHNVFFATGNAIPCTGAVRSDSVIRTNPTLGSPTFFQPQDWGPNWCGPDSDLGSASPVLISPNLLFQAGKHGGGFLVNPTNLGGTDGQLYPPGGTSYSQADVCAGQHSDATFGSFAYAAPYVYLECESPSTGLGLVALKVNTSAPSFTPCGSSCPAPDWHVGGTTRFGPPIVAAGAVWAASDNGLTAYNATTGALIYQSASFGVNRFVTPSEAGGQVFVPSHNVIRSFSFAGNITFTPTNLDFNGQATGTTSATQTVALHNNLPGTLTIATAALSGANASSYAKGTDGCTGMAVASGGTCTVQVSFKPAMNGGLPATLTFTDNGPGSPQAVALSGMGALDNQAHLYTLDGYGGLHADGSAPALSTTAYWPGWNIARGFAVFPDALGGYVLDGYGGLHPFGNATAAGGFAYWPGWDIARQVVLAPWSSQTSPAGWTLDGYGGIHPFGGAPSVSGFAYWPGWDIARGLVVLPDSTPSSVAGYTLDGYGGIHPFGGAATADGFAYWPGWDIAHSIALSPNASKTNPAGWTLDGYGGIHPFGGAPALAISASWPGWDIARGLVAWTGNGVGGWVLDGYGGIHPVGSAPAVSSAAYWPGWDIAMSLGGPTFSSGARRRG